MTEEGLEIKIARLEEKFAASEKALKLAYVQSIVAAALAAFAVFHK